MAEAYPFRRFRPGNIDYVSSTFYFFHSLNWNTFLVKCDLLNELLSTNALSELSSVSGGYEYLVLFTLVSKV